MIVNFYDKTKLVGSYYANSLEEVKANPKAYYPGYTNEIITDVEFAHPVLDNGELREATRDELVPQGIEVPLNDGEYIKDNKIIAIEQPSKWHKWSGTEWVANIEEVRKAKRNELKATRHKKQNEDFTFMGKVFQASEKDMRNIETKFMSYQMALTLAEKQVDKDLILNQKEEWTLKDNTKFTMSAREILALYMAWDNRNKQIHYHCNTELYDLLAKAKTIQKIEAIKWE